MLSRARLLLGGAVALCQASVIGKEDLIKPFRIAVLAAFAVFIAAQAHAASTPTPDPVIRTGGGGGSVAITSPVFGIVTPSGNSPELSTLPGSTDCVLIQPGTAPTTAPGCFFKNEITMPPRGVANVTITRLNFVVDNADFSGTLTCGTNTALGGPGPFATCRVQPVGDATSSIVTFFNGSIPSGGDFSLGTRGFNGNTTFAVVGFRSPSLLASYGDPVGNVFEWFSRPTVSARFGPPLDSTAQVTFQRNEQSKRRASEPEAINAGPGSEPSQRIPRQRSWDSPKKRSAFSVELVSNTTGRGREVVAGHWKRRAQRRRV